MTKHGATWTPRDHRKHAKKMARKGSLGFKPVPNAAARTTVQWMRDCGASNAVIEKQTGLTHDFVWRWAGRSEATAKGGRGPQSLIGSELGKQLVKSVVKVRWMSAEKLRSDIVNPKTNKPVARSTIQDALKREGLISKRVRRGQMLTTAQKACRLRWCEEHLKLQTDFKDWIFSDEKWWCVGGVQGNERMWVFADDPFPDELFVPTVSHPVKVHIWAAISYDGRSSLHIHDGKVDSQVYCKCLDDAFLPCLWEKDYLALKKRSNYVFMQDGARCHTANSTYDWLKKNLPKNIKHHTKGEWPASSPDLNPIERLWAILQDRVIEARAYCYEDLVKVVEKVWWELDQDTIRKLYNSMPTRCRKCVNSEGGRFMV